MIEACIGQVLSRENTMRLWDADALLGVEGKTSEGALAIPYSIPLGLKPFAYVQAARTETGRSHA